MITSDEIQSRDTLIYDCKFFGTQDERIKDELKDLRNYYNLSADDVKTIVANERAKLGKREYDSGFRL